MGIETVKVEFFFLVCVLFSLRLWILLCFPKHSHKTDSKVSNHHFKWWFANSPIRAEYMRRLKAGVASHSCFFRLKRPIRFLLFVHGFFGLTPDVFFHGFFVHVSDRRYIVPSGPKTSVPFTPQFWMLTEDHQRRLSFEIPHKISDTQFRRDAYT